MLRSACGNRSSSGPEHADAQALGGIAQIAEIGTVALPIGAPTGMARCLRIDLPLMISIYDIIPREPPSPPNPRADLCGAGPCRSAWRDIEALLRAARAEISEGAGSRVFVASAGGRAVFHRPHPGPETRRGLVRAVRDFPIAAGVRRGEE